MRDLFPNESIQSIQTEAEHLNWHMYFDEAGNVYGNGIRAILISPTGAHLLEAIKLRFPSTNNIAEYETCISGLEVTLDISVKT